MTVFRHWSISILLLAAGLMTGCATVSFDKSKSYSSVIIDTNDTYLGKTVADWVEAHDGLSGFYPLTQGMDALGVRLRLAKKAERSIDLQYFLMKTDTAGAVIATALRKAADRGVRVRFLIDDLFTTVSDHIFLLLNQHDNIEVRIFNPVSRRGSSGLNFIGYFDQANRRMHNKSFTVDNVISVVGGRNLADEYFQLKTDSVFVDFDVLAAGPIAADISRSFDEYWNHSRSVPVEQLAGSPKEEDLESVRAAVADEFGDIYTTVFEKALDSQLLQDLIAGRRSFYAAPARVVADIPDKLVNKIDEAYMQLALEVGGVVRGAEREVILVSPYYVPGNRGVQLVRDLVVKGVRVVIITNSLASNNHIPVHSAYAHYRKDVIRAGAELYEARANAARQFQAGKDGPETLTLHTKVFFIDRRKMFVGSLNLDPRSIELNAEMGLVIDSEEMVASLLQGADDRRATMFWRVLLNNENRLEWHSRIDNQEVIETKEPQTSGWMRFKAWFFKIAPESQL